MALHHPFFSAFLIGSRSIKLTVFCLGRVPDLLSQCFLVFAFSWYYFPAYFYLLQNASSYIPTPFVKHLVCRYHLNKLYFFLILWNIVNLLTCLPTSPCLCVQVPFLLLSWGLRTHLPGEKKTSLSPRWKK